MNSFKIIIKPLLTEKTTLLHDFNNQIAFEVAKGANKIQIKNSIEKIFNVKVLNISTVNVTGKKKRLGRHAGKRPNWKKAIVTLAEGHKIEYFEGA